VCHRDIKPQNILVTKDKSQVVLVDFNVAKKFEFYEPRIMFTRGAGTLAFAAPERLSEGGAGYTEKVDIWAAGILLVMLLLGYHPFSDHNGSTPLLIKQIINGEQIIKELIQKQTCISEEAKSLVCSLIKTNYLERPSAEEALKHPWFEKEFKEHETVPLETALDKLYLRRVQKINNPDEFEAAEGKKMSLLTVEILKFGIQMQPKYQKHHSMILDKKSVEKIFKHVN
jgi:calcium/calmodulin-dependent protein kinase I